TAPQATAGAGDFTYGGDGLDVLIANSGYDRMYDWGGKGDDFTPNPVLQTGTTFNVGDTNHNNQLDPGETWQYASSGAASYQVQGGLYVNIATVTATGTNGKTVNASDPNYHFGTTPSLFVLKATMRRTRCTRP